MNLSNLLLCIGSMICSIFAALIGAEILPPIDPIYLSVILLIMMELFFVYMAVNNSKGEDDGEDQNERDDY